MNLLAYIQGERKGKEAHRIERESMRDPFLADALDGYDSVDGDHGERIGDIRKRVSTSGRKLNRRFAFISIAASLILSISIGGYFLMNKNEHPLVAQSEMAVHEEDRTEEIIPESTSEADEQAAGNIAEVQDEQNQDNFETERRDVVVESSPVPPPPPVAQDQLIAIADDVAAEKEMEIQQPEIAAVDVSKDSKDSLMIAQTEPSQPGRFTTPSGTGQRAMTSAASVKPEPKIGMKAYKKYLKDSMKRPETGDCAKKKGEVIVEFKINAEGRPHNIEFRKKLCEDLDKEAIRLIENGPVWVGDTAKSVILEVKF